MDHRQRARLDASAAALGQQTFPSQIRHGFPYAPSFPESAHFAGTGDVAALQTEIVRLKQLLKSAHSQTEKQAAAYRRAMHETAERASNQHRNEAAQHRENATRAIDHLKSQLETEREQFKKRDAERLRQLNDAQRETEQAQQASKSLAEQTRMLKQELSHLASTAAEEQHQLQLQLVAQTTRCDEIRATQKHRTDSLEQSLKVRNRQLVYWSRVHQLATSLCDDYHNAVSQSRIELQQLKSDYQHLHDELENACGGYEEEIERLHDQIDIAQTDHESVELTNAQLDYLLAEQECEKIQLQFDLEQVIVSAARDRQESAACIKDLDEQFQLVKSRLNAACEEKSSLVKSLGKYKSAANEFDATMFAKDQEIVATRRMAEKFQQKLDQAHRVHAITVSENEGLRNRIRELSGRISELETELSAVKGRAEQAENLLLDRDCQIREIQSASRAAEANALVAASEIEQQMSIEIQRLETEIEELKSKDLSTVAVSAVSEPKVASDWQSGPAEQLNPAEQSGPAETNEQTERIAELERQQITLRERHHQSQVANERLIESLNQEVSSLLAEKESTLHTIAELEINNRFLQRDLEAFSKYENPLNEVKRLSRELSKKIAEHARQRDALVARIEELTLSRQQNRAA